MTFDETVYETEQIIIGVESYRGSKTSGIRILKNVAKRLTPEAKEDALTSERYLYYPGEESWALAIFELKIEGQGLMVPARKIIARKHHRYIINNDLQKDFGVEFDLFGGIIKQVA